MSIEPTKTETTPEATPETTKPKKTKLILLALAALLAVGGLAFGLYLHAQGAAYLATDNARVTTTIVPILSPGLGTLTEFALIEGDRVKEDQVIARLLPADSVLSGPAAFWPLRPPIDGVVVKTQAVSGQMVAPGQPIAVLADVDAIRIEANIEETRIARVAVGQQVTVTIDALGRREFAGYVTQIGRITQAELTGSALFFNTGGTFTRVTHLIPVEIILTDDVNLESLIGVNARVRIHLS